MGTHQENAKVFKALCDPKRLAICDGVYLPHERHLPSWSASGVVMASSSFTASSLPTSLKR